MNELPENPVDGYAPDEPPAEREPAPEEAAIAVDADQPVAGEPFYETDLEDDRPDRSAEETAFHEEEDSPEQVAEDLVNDEISDERVEENGVRDVFEADVEEAVADAEAAAEAEGEERAGPQQEPEPAPEEEVEVAEPAEPEAEVAEPVEEVTAAEPEETAAEPEAVTAAEPEEEPAAPDPFRGPGDWYVVHTYAGYENKVKTNLESRIHTMQMEDKIFHVHIPMEDVMEIKGGKRQVVQRKVFPGYLLVKMLYDNDSWYVVRNTPGVTGFVAAGTGSKPTPLSKREVEKILVVKKEDVKPAFRLGFEEGDVVRIISGPFADFNGTISEINLDQSKLKVLVNIFDRETPVELSFDQVAKV
jgi:transcriptional antiterminator NusG